MATWEDRNKFLENFNVSGKTVIGFGCGDQNIRKYFQFKNYLGIDKENADVNIDFDKQFIIPTTAELGLVLGVLEYLENPDFFLQKVKNTCDRFIIMVLDVKAPKHHHGWKRVYNENDLLALLTKYFYDINLQRHGKYIVADCYSNFSSKI